MTAIIMNNLAHTLFDEIDDMSLLSEMESLPAEDDLPCD